MNSQYILPHPLDRPGQQPTSDRIKVSNARYILVQAPTGSGKSAWVADASIAYRVMVLTETKSLQVDNYLGEYGFDIALGRGNYTCGETGDSAELCPDKRCQCVCEYATARQQAIESPRLSVNYAKYVLDTRLAQMHETDILFLDEAHRTPNIVTEASGIEIAWDNKFVDTSPSYVPSGSSPISRSRGMQTLTNLAKLVRANEPPWYSGPRPREHVAWSRLLMKIKTVMAYAQSGDGPSAWYWEGNEDALIVKPLTARYNFTHMFNSADKVVLMSATVGSHTKLAHALGIEDDYEYIQIDGEFPPDQRPVVDMGCPKMSYKSSDADYNRQANIIVDQINALPSHWTGIIHTKSKKAAYKLQARMHGSMVDTCIIPKWINGTENQLEYWNSQREPGRWLIHWAFWEGVNLGADNGSIVAKVPFGYTGDDYGKASYAFDRQVYSLRAAQDLEQACGRVRRGHKEHYGPNAEKFVGIADGNWRKIEGFFSDDFRRSIIT